MHARYVGYFFCALAMIGVGSTVVVSKAIAGGLPPFSATALRFAIAFPIFVAMMRVRRLSWPKLDTHDRWLAIAQAGAGSVGYTVCLIGGMRLASAADAGVIAGTLPAVSAAVAALALGERPSPALLGAIVLATGGVLACTVRLDDLTAPHGAHSLAGNALVFAAVVCEALFILLNRKLRTPVAALPLSALMSGIGFVVAIVPACFEAPWRLPLDASLTAALAGVVYYALVPTVLGFVLWYAGAARVSGAEAGLVTALVPVSTLALAAGVLHEPISRAQLMGVACVLMAMLLATFGQGRPMSARRAAG
ncbi:DMT family transporter [Paraburkholderia diazotrophica]|uniref:Permease of the drug/metabolite transporter (DMT) superfamily n=1 Tax=Paraburkholderia diazotrophica TaxID=667676 RepID=A0A1H6SZA9_9BURK|nr:DMT family transporter [Paraburkholderia diazotrophica]SEI69295.1 Permease of the drug/metabolite transporter (DMT) superfamily [Paraburkholderia diazotrophica]